MLFNSYRFLAFFPAVVLLYWCCPKKLRHVWLLIVSCVYYACFAPKFLLMLLYVGAVSYAGGLVLSRAKSRRRLLLAAGLVLVFAPLCAYKYTQFLLDNLSRALGLIGRAWNPPLLRWATPVGISFYSFMASGYLIDVYRGQKAERNPLYYGAFITYFPVLSSGPIERSTTLLRQLREERVYSSDQVRKGLMMMMWGYFLKLVIADRAGMLVDTVWNGLAGFSGFELIAAALLYAVQIYCDFASYSFLALGAGEVMGLELTRNFNTPYFSLSVAEFWRRWHISLSGWFRDYLYIPLGGNRKGTARKYLNVIIVFLVSGLWHGAGWTYIIWGLLNGLYQVIGALTKPCKAKLAKVLRVDPENGGNRFFRMVCTFLLIDFSWIFFRSANLSEAAAFLRRCCVWNPWVLLDGSMLKLGLDSANWTVLLLAIALLFAMSLCRYRGVDVRDRLLKQGVAFRWLCYIVFIVMVLVFGIWGAGYSASSFIYFQF